MISTKLNVIVGLDFSEFSCFALDHAVGLSKYIRTKLHLTYVIESDSSINEMMEKVKVETRLWFEKKLSETIDKLSLKLPDYEIHILTGKTGEQILKLGEELKAHFIFVGCNSHDHSDHIEMGSNVSKLVPRAACPLVILKECDNHKPFTNIIFPIKLKSYETDFRENGALKYAIKFMEQFSSMNIHLISVLQNKEDFEINKATQLMLSIQELFDQHNIRSSAEIIKCHKAEEKISDVISDYAKRIGADILFLGQSNKKSISIAAQNICNKINIPIIVIK